MNAKEFFTKGWPTRLGFYMGKYLPRHGGMLGAGIAARTLVTLKPDIYHAVRDNQRQVLGPDVTAAELHRATYYVLRGAARNYYEMFHNIGRGRVNVENFHPPVRLLPEAEANIRAALETGRGLLLLGCHMSNFDMSGMAFSQYAPSPVLVLALADPPPGFELFNELRRKGGAHIMPISPRSLREALVILREGGLVLTGIDRPVAAEGPPVEFFGAPSALPSGYVRIPLKTNSLVCTLCTYYEEGEYHIHINPPLEMEYTGDRDLDVTHNLRRILAEIEAFIRREPQQWMMFVRVWPELSQNTP